MSRWMASAVTVSMTAALMSFGVSDVFAEQDPMWSSQADPSDESTPGEVVTPKDFNFKLASEFGLLSVISNKSQQGRDGTYFDYVEDGGFELFVPFLRASGELNWKGRHNAIFLYQPIDLRSRVRLDDELIVDGQTFPEGKMLDIRYGFDFFRATYHYDLSPREDLEIGVGGGFQMRIAELEFIPIDGSEGRINRDLGPVPLLKFRARKDFSSGYWVGTEIDGFYANIKIVNGDRNAEVTGAILDASLRGGVALGEGLDGFLNVRYVGGGGEGSNPDEAENGIGDGYVKNWISLMAISLGFYFEPSALVR